jgi:hypothetical protein
MPNEVVLADPVGVTNSDELCVLEGYYLLNVVRDNKMHTFD